MGFEVVYKYHEKGDDGYNKEETKTTKKKVGDPFEEVPLEKLAASIMAQLARRDIWVTDVEVFELSKKEVSFKETKGGIVIKNKKFLFDADLNVVVQDMVEARPEQPAPQLPSGPVASAGVQPHNQGQLRPIDWVIFQPELPMMPEVKRKGLKFTPDKKYPVFEKSPHPTLPHAQVYKMIDDTGREQLVSDQYFVPGNVSLFMDKELGFSETSKQRDGGNLLWGNAANEPDMPVLRRK